MAQVRALDSRGIEALSEIVALNPVRHCYAASRIAAGKRGLIGRGYNDVIGAYDDGALRAGLILGANVVPIWTDTHYVSEFRTLLSRQGRRCSSIVGPVDHVNALWEQLRNDWGSPRVIRARQPVMALREYPRIQPDNSVRYARPSDLDVLLPACIDMFTSEVGVSPIAHGAGPAYRSRISDLIASRKSFVRTDDRGVVFKAEVGVVGANVAQIQGVWVRPDLRGRGIAVPAMAAVVRKVLEDIAGVCSLYVNDFNAPALATYRTVGFEQVDEFSTVMF